MNGNSRTQPLYTNTFADSTDQSVSHMCFSPECVSDNIPAPELQPSPKEAFSSIFNFWSDMEQSSSRSASVTMPRFNPPLLNGFSRLRPAVQHPSSGTTSDMDSISNSTSSKPLMNSPSKVPGYSVPSIQSEESSDIDNLSAAYEIVVPPKTFKIPKSQPPQPKKAFPQTNRATQGQCMNIEVVNKTNGNHYQSKKPKPIVVEQRSESPPTLPPKSPLLRPVSRNGKAVRLTDYTPVNGFPTLPHMNGDRQRSPSVEPPELPAKTFRTNGVNPSNNVNNIRVNGSNFTHLNPNFRYSLNRPPAKPPKSEMLRSSSVFGRGPTSSDVLPPRLPHNSRPTSATQSSTGLIEVRYPTMTLNHTRPANAEQKFNRTRSAYGLLEPQGFTHVPRRSSTVRRHDTPYQRSLNGYSDNGYVVENSYRTISSSPYAVRRPSRSTSELRQAHTSKSGSNRSIGTTDTSSISPNTADENLVMVGILPNSDGQYGFNVSGGADQKKPVIVSRVGENMPAGMCCPRLHVGDQIISINDHDISEFTQDQVVSCIRKSAKSHSRLLKLVVKSNAVYLAENAVDDQYPETGDAPPRPPKAKSPAIPAVSPAPTPSLTELSLTPTHHGNGIHNHHRTTSRSPGIAPSTTTPTSSGLFSLPQTALKPTATPQPPRVTPKPRITSVSGGGNAGTVRVKSSSSVGPRRALVSDTEALYHSIRAIENGLGDGSLVRTFEKLERGNPSATMRDAKESFNLSKNRYRDISPYDHSRVKIQGVDGDYINASFIEMRIPKSSLKRDYIASQGPLPNTCADFWQMCWEHGSELIVMLTSVLEQGRVKCHKYWPDLNHTSEFTWIHPKLQRSSTSNATNSSPKYIQLRVSNIKEEANADIAYREFQLQRIVNAVNPKDHGSSAKHRITGFSNEKGPSLMNDSEVRRVIQLQYISWPDHGVPSNCSDLINFVEKMREIRERSSSACAVVHCSAGIGRTGVVILLDTAMDMIRSHASVNPIEMVRQMREYREMLIQTPAQFRFVCETIVKYYNDTILKPSTIKKS